MGVHHGAGGVIHRQQQRELRSSPLKRRQPNPVIHAEPSIWISIRPLPAAVPLPTNPMLRRTALRRRACSNPAETSMRRSVLRSMSIPSRSAKQFAQVGVVGSGSSGCWPGVIPRLWLPTGVAFGRSDHDGRAIQGGDTLPPVCPSEQCARCGVCSLPSGHGEPGLPGHLLMPAGCSGPLVSLVLSGSTTSSSDTIGA